MKIPSQSVYMKSLSDKILAANILLPLIEFEFAFNGAQKPVLTQSKSNLRQLQIVFEICKNHGWLSENKISKLGNKEEFCFKLNNSAFKEIYEIAGPMADPKKDQWAKLVCERANSLNKNRKIKQEILTILKNSDKEISTLELCLKLRRLPYTVTRHLRNLEKQTLVIKNDNGWKSIGTPVNSSS